MIVRWKNFLDSMKQYLLQTQNLTFLSESYEGLTLEILTRIPSIVPSGKRTGDVKKFVLQIYEENTALDEVLPARSDPPRLIAIGDVSKSISLFAYVDGTAVFSEKCPMKSVLLLLATYWVFNIQFAAESRPAFQLISSAILKEQMFGKQIMKCSGAVDCLLKQLNL
ncbi:hypothetical protein AVEN_82704-1 [Araneus ventricosus]|uniref:Uncharacterized protein n=1 Tax=Araneus ventricosus TaxID=182803 RepID=A0A4Y2Q3N7_ARAVE|nr:hypothetical protein AVEN_82704-1 [Araneus ventricosus]